MLSNKDLNLEIFTAPDGKQKKLKVELFTWEKLDMVKPIKKLFKIK